jgi:hypothetical protein
MGAWLEKLANHPGGGVALIFARTETKVFFDQVWDKATGIFFIRGRLSFYRPDGSKGDSAGSPSVLISYGHREAQILKSVNLSGKFIDLRRTSGEFE